MPFKSKAQQAYLYAKHPDVAKKYAAETPKSAYGKLPGHVKKQHTNPHHQRKGS